MKAKANKSLGSKVCWDNKKISNMANLHLCSQKLPNTDTNVRVQILPRRNKCCIRVWLCNINSFHVSLNFWILVNLWLSDCVINKQQVCCLCVFLSALPFDFCALHSDQRLLSPNPFIYSCHSCYSLFSCHAGFADIPSGPSCPYIVRRGLLGTSVVPVPQKKQKEEETD